MSGPTDAEREQYVLGEDVTDLAVSRRKPSGVVLSFRLTIEELAAIEVIASREDRTISSIARRAVRQYLRQKNWIGPNAISVGNPVTVSFTIPGGG